MNNPYAQLPAITALLADPRVAALPHALAAGSARAVVDAARAAIGAGAAPPADFVQATLDHAEQQRALRLRPVINATGVVLHTNLGRAPLAPEAADAVSAVARSYSNLEMHLDSGERGGRLEGIQRRLRALTGAEDVIVVNNCAAAVLLALTALARDGEVIVSRGELVEIGGSFRVPAVVSAGGARLVEVGTTNRTRAADFAAAITEDTRVLLRVHPSNFRVLGFTERPDRAALVALARERGVVLVEDLGSGLLGAPPVAGAGLEAEGLDVTLQAGVDLVCCSGDKLLGGPQAGIIAGRRDVVRQLRAHPLYRALRCDKLVLAALEATLQMFAEGRGDAVPSRAMLGRSGDELRAAAEALSRQIPGSRVEPDETFSGGGALPGWPLPAWVVVVPGGDPGDRCRRLRMGAPPVVARVARDALILDPRTVLPGQAAPLAAAVRGILGDSSSSPD